MKLDLGHYKLIWDQGGSEGARGGGGINERIRVSEKGGLEVSYCYCE